MIRLCFTRWRYQWICYTVRMLNFKYNQSTVNTKTEDKRVDLKKNKPSHVSWSCSSACFSPISSNASPKSVKWHCQDDAEGWGRIKQDQVQLVRCVGWKRRSLGIEQVNECK